MVSKRAVEEGETTALAQFSPAVQRWFARALGAPTRVQTLAFEALAERASALVLAPTGSGKTLAAFLLAIDRLMFSAPPTASGVRVLYVSPLKALGVDVERNLSAPLLGIAEEAARGGEAHRIPTLGVRSGDTPAAVRARVKRSPPEILITTPESLFLILSSSTRSVLRTVETVIVDEIHALAPTKRGAHLFLSLERLEAEVAAAGGGPLQRVGLSATQRPLEEVARLLGGGTVDDAGVWSPRPVRIVSAGSRRALEVTVEVPVEDMARLDEGARDPRPANASEEPSVVRSIWPSIHQRLVERIREHRSTIVFVNSRRLAERLAAAINDTAGEALALAHHGSLAREARLAIEEALKSGHLRAIVATSSLELGIDMGAVDLVLQIESPPSVSAGLQRVGRAGHSVAGVSRGVVFPKHRGDLLAAAAVVRCMKDGLVESIRYPRNPLDVLAQHVVSIAAVEPISVEALLACARGAASYAELSRSSFEGVLDMLSGHYPSDELADLRPRIIWDRSTGMVRARQGAGRIAIVNAGTIPDRGLYGVFLAGDDDRSSRRVGELDEEMVFESRVGDVFVLGASSWRIQEITFDRVLVCPAPSEPGRLPFWRGDRPGRPLELGRAIGSLARSLVAEPRDAALLRLSEAHGLDPRAAENLLVFLETQARATGVVPSDRTIVVERVVDEIGDARLCVLTPFGSSIHTPWAAVVRARLAEIFGCEIEALWSDDGMVFRLPGTEAVPDVHALFPNPAEVRALVRDTLADTSLFAARFREAAQRALLLPRRQPGRRTPLWSRRKRARDLLTVALRYTSFPLVLEAYRECLVDVFDLSGLVEVLEGVAKKSIEVVSVDARSPSPFAASLLFSYVASFIYAGDAPVAERRAQALTLDHAQLVELFGDADLAGLLDPEVIDAYERGLLFLDDRVRLRHADAVHDLLRTLGDLGLGELRLRVEPELEGALEGWLRQLEAEGRVLSIAIAEAPRFIAAEDAARYRDALDIVLPANLAPAFLEGGPNARRALVHRFARRHGPFHARAVAKRLGLSLADVEQELRALVLDGRVVEGALLPGEKAFCETEVLRELKRRTLAKLRREVEPVDAATFARFSLEWHGIAPRRRGADALLAVIEQLQGLALPASVLEREIFPARVSGYRPEMLDALTAAGEVVWCGVEALGAHDDRIALYLADHASGLAPPPRCAEGVLAERIRALLTSRGALFFRDIVKATGAFPADLARGLFELIWAGEITNDTLAPLRARHAQGGSERIRGSRHPRGRFGPAARPGLPGTEGRWSMLPRERSGTETERAVRRVESLLTRHGVLTREAVLSENVPGGFSALYPVLEAMESAGRVRRGLFVAGLAPTQFARAGAEERLRRHRDEPKTDALEILAANDPANPYGASLSWPDVESGPPPARAAGAQVLLVNGRLMAYVGRTERNLITFLPANAPEREIEARRIANGLAALVRGGRRRALLIERIDGAASAVSSLGPCLLEVGFIATRRGFLLRSSPRAGDESPGVD